jgi:hypothetical protein
MRGFVESPAFIPLLGLTCALVLASLGGAVVAVVLIAIL